MDGVHDLGGWEGFGPIDVDEPLDPFHAPWEARLFGITRAFTEPVWTSLELFRLARECIDPAEYLTRRYYDQWLAAHATLLVFTGAATVEELATGRSQRPIDGVPAPMSPGEVASAKRRMNRFDRPSDATPAFAPGDKVRTRPSGVSEHTRLPQYARGHVGTIDTFHGFHVFPDANIEGHGAAAPLYGVSFTAAELWPEANGRNDRIHLDLWEAYLERA
jgi:nitrile hydratase